MSVAPAKRQPAREVLTRNSTPTEHLVDSVGYVTGEDHLRDELLRVDGILRMSMMAQGAAYPQNLADALALPFEYPPTGIGQLSPTDTDAWAIALDRARMLRSRIDRAVGPCRTTLPLAILVERFGLTSYERDAILLAALGELDPRVARWFGILQADDRRREPSVGLIQTILGPIHEGAPSTVFASSSKLVAHRLVQIGTPYTQSDPFTAQAVRVEPRVLAFIRGNTEPETRATVRLVPRPASIAVPPQREAVLRRLAELWSNTQSKREHGLTVWLQSPRGGAEGAAHAIARDTPLFAIDTPAAIAGTDGPHWANFVTQLYREARLTGTAVHWDDADALLAADAAQRFALVLDFAERFAGLTLFSAVAVWDASRQFLDPAHPFLRADIPGPSFALRRDSWHQTLSGLPDVATAGGTDTPDTLATSLANAFQLTEAQIREAAVVYRGLRLLRTPGDNTGVRADLFDACRRLFSHRRVAFAKAIPPGSSASDPWHRLVVPPPVRQQLRELSARAELKSRVYDDLKFGERMSLGRGLVALFAGPSGTGKTMAATALAASNGVDLYKVDLAAVVSKWVGETEAQLDRVLTEAEAANAYVFFDEADCLFGKRGEVKEARDRWANMQVNYLLQRVEEFAGTVILATNFRQNIDDAFLRRIHVIVDFPIPDAVERAKILQNLFPTTVTPPSEEDIRRIATRFPLTGGALKNVVLDAAFRVARQSGRPQVTIHHLVVGVAREYQKVGKPITRNDFGDEFYRTVTEAFSPAIEKE